MKAAQVLSFIDRSTLIIATVDYTLFANGSTKITRVIVLVEV